MTYFKDDLDIPFEQTVIDRMTFTPGYKAMVFGMDKDTYELCLDSEERTVDASNPERKFPKGLCVISFPRRKLARQVAMDVAVCHAISEFHEAIEFIKLDGERLAEPHPDIFEQEHWDFLTNRIGRVMRDYVKAFPA